MKLTQEERERISRMGWWSINSSLNYILDAVDEVLAARPDPVAAYRDRLKNTTLDRMEKRHAEDLCRAKLEGKAEGTRWAAILARSFLLENELSEAASTLEELLLRAAKAMESEVSE